MGAELSVAAENAKARRGTRGYDYSKLGQPSRLAQMAIFRGLEWPSYHWYYKHRSLTYMAESPSTFWIHCDTSCRDVELTVKTLGGRSVVLRWRYDEPLFFHIPNILAFLDERDYDWGTVAFVKEEPLQLLPPL